MLNVNFAHFFFMSGHLEWAQSLFDRYPNVRFDVTPGTEMYVDFSRRPKEFHDFFVKNQDRIFYGTDIIVRNAHYEDQMDESVAWIHTLRRFFETKDTVDVHGESVTGIALPEGVCRRLFVDNFMDFIGNCAPKPVDSKAAAALCDGYMAVLPPGKEKTKEVLKSLREVL